jgi:ubiquinone/menaquinone biosynthesis C-methylase UbiE
MPRLTDQEYLLTDQYKDASNLNARVLVHQHFSTNDYPWQRWVFDHLDLREGSDILDVGCGPGDLWLENGDRLPSGWTIVLSDLSPGMVQKARHQLGSCSGLFRYHVHDAQAIPFPDESFDVVVANHMLYHVPDRDRVLYEIHRVLRPGGRLYAATNGLTHLVELRDMVARFCSDTETPSGTINFGLENGAAQLSRWFAEVTRYRQENSLVVTEAEPLIAYAKSMTCRPTRREEKEAFARSVREEIAARGALHIQKDSGMFEAMKA